MIVDFLLGEIFVSDEDTPPPWERNILSDVNSMTSSSEHVCAEDKERLKHHSPLIVYRQYNESSGAEWKGSNITNNTTLENFHCDETAEEPVILNPGQETER